MRDISPRRAQRIKFDELSHQVIGCAIEVHRILGSGLLESAYDLFCALRALRGENNGWGKMQTIKVFYTEKNL
jgi:hypothetical protein